MLYSLFPGLYDVFQPHEVIAPKLIGRWHSPGALGWRFQLRSSPVPLQYLQMAPLCCPLEDGGSTASLPSAPTCCIGAAVRCDSAAERAGEWPGWARREHARTAQEALKVTVGYT